MTEEEISKASGLPLHLVFAISRSTSWHGIDFPTMRLFLVACAIDFENYTQMKRVDSYLRMKPTWKYLRVSPLWPAYFQPLMNHYFKSTKL